MRVLALVFSAGKGVPKSGTLARTEEICQKIRMQFGEGTQTQILTMADFTLGYCTGCLSCFQKGSCPQDAADDMGMLREKIAACDALIVATPVYLGSVSGGCKTFLDRCSYYSHIFELAGKPCLVLSMADATRAEETADYLSMCMELMGCAVAAVLPFQEFGGSLVPGTPEAEDAVSSAVIALGLAHKTPEKFISGRAQTQFASMQAIARAKETYLTLTGQRCPAEVDLFRRRGYMNSTSLPETVRQAREVAAEKGEN